MSIDSEYQAKLAWVKENPTLCIDPYHTLDVRKDTPTKQVVTCCCNLNIRDFVPDPGSDPFKKIKEQQSAGQWPKDCNTCRLEELHGGTSERIRTILSYDLSVLKKFSQEQKLNSSELRIKFSNVCTLACRSCTPTDSTTWAKIGNLEAEVEWRSVDLSNDPSVWNFITQYILDNHCKIDNFYVHLMGGEPLVQPGARKLMQWIINSGLAKQIGIRLTTSLNPRINQDLADIFCQFKSVSFGLSIDSVGDNYHLVRWPGKFKRVEENINLLVQIKNQHKLNWQFNLSPVFSLNNVFYIREYLDYWYNWSKEHNVYLNWMTTNLVLGTQFLDIQALPVRYRAQLKEYLIDCKQHPIFADPRNQSMTMYSFLSSTVTELDHWPENLNLWDMYLEVSAEFDVRTNTSSAELNSKLFDLLTHNDKNLFQNKLNSIDVNKKLIPRTYLLQQINLDKTQREISYKQFVKQHKIL